ncbi:MAG: ABC transporter substrate-binding protein [Candidatus Kapabacteria bacterium]|nr:ABC transporter substrate-binding protein [Candidatus Kapabacteria bacterium]
MPERKTTALRPAKGGRNYGGYHRMNMIRGNPSGLDPVMITSTLADDIALQIYNRLISFDSSLNVVPELASSWDIRNNGTQYVFHLRSDVRFHNDVCFPKSAGRRMTAHDVVYSYKRCCDPTTKSAQFWVFKDKVIGANEYYAARREKRSQPDAIRGLYATNDTTVIIELTRPYAPFLMQLANALGCVVPREAVEYYGADFFRHPVGTGAFRLSAWNNDYQMTLARNPDYWEYDSDGNRLPYLDSIRISFVTDDKVQYQQFVSGELEESLGIPTEFFPIIYDTKTRTPRPLDNAVVQSKPAMLTWFIDFLCTKPPFNNVHLRRACSYSIDRERIVKFVLRNSPHSPATNGITPPVFPGYATDSIQGIQFNPRQALNELRLGGYANGSDVPPITLHIYPEPRLIQVAEAVQQMLSENLNIKMTIKVIQFAQLLDLAEKGDLMMWGTRWYGDYPDAENYLSLLDGSLVPTDNSQPSYPNSTRYNNTIASNLLARAVATTDITERNALYRNAEQRSIKDAPAILLFYEMHYRLLRPYICNYPLDPMNRIQLRYVWYDYKAVM